MKTLRILIGAALLATAFNSRAQMDEEEGWFNTFVETPDPAAFDISAGNTNHFGNGYFLSGITDAIAEAITPDIAALARGLENDPQKIFDYVHEQIRYVHYFGSKKGAQLTLMEGSGNEFDQCALLVALLRSSGYTNTTYQFGAQKVPYESADHHDFRHWIGLWKPNTWNESLALAFQLSYLRGYPAVYTYGDSTNFALHRLWVKLPLNGTNYLLDPAFRINELSNGIDLIAATGMSSNELWTAAGGTVAGNSVADLTESTLRDQLRDYTTSLVAYLGSNAPNASVKEVLGGWQTVPTNHQSLGTQPTWSLVFPEVGYFPVSEWSNIPTNWMSRMTISFGNSNLTFCVPELQGRRLSLVFTNGQSQLWLDDDLVLQRANVLSNNMVNVTMTMDHPHKTYNKELDIWSDSTRNDQSSTKPYRTNGMYAVIYAFEAGPSQLRKRQERLDAYRQSGLADTSREVMSETLNVIGQSWMLQSEMVGYLISAQSHSLSQFHHRFGRMAYEPSFGYYVDVYLEKESRVSAQGDNIVDRQSVVRAFDVSTYFSSSMEHGVIEQLQSSNLVAASTIKMLQLANDQGIKLYLLTSYNWSTVSAVLLNYNLTYLQGLVNAGHRLLLPKNGEVQIAGTGSWKGYGIMDKLETSSQLSMGALISGGYQGGYSAFSYSVPSPSYIATWAYSAPSYFNPQPMSVAPIRAADPVNMVDGSFTVSENDLTLGQTEPRGLSFSRDYSSSRRHHNLAGLGDGWTHNYFMNLAEVSAPQPALGDTTPAQMAAMLVATRAVLEVYATNNVAKNWATTALIAKWAVDQIRSNAVSIALGNDAVQFIKQPDGQWTPPSGSTMSLLRTNSVYWLQERHGRTFKFDKSGRLTNIVDQYNQPLTVAYVATTSNLPSTVTDWKGRSLTFSYSGTPTRLDSVTDSTGRSVAYGFTAGGGRLDLSSVTDPENKTHTFQYDTNHQIVAARDAANRLVTTNVYDGFGRVITQYTEGDTNKTWQLYWAGSVSVEQNPSGSKRRYYYDEKHRHTIIEDALGNLVRMYYDGQDHTVMTVSPLNETNQFIYDGNHNLLAAIDPLGFSNQLAYDSLFHLVATVDARGFTNRFGYNAQHSLIGSTNGAGDWTILTYNANGTLATNANSGGATSYGYDSTYGQLNSITYPGGLGGESFVSDPRGDVTNHINARGFATSFQYNLRRELTNTISPTNVTASVRYDDIGNVQSSQDARGFTTANTWSATRHLLSISLPATPQGTPTMTNVFDSRDWLVKIIDPLQKATTVTNDAAQRLISITDPLSRSTRFGYDAVGRRLAATNALQEVTRQQWNARSEAIKTTDNAGHTLLNTFDGAGNQITLTNRNGKKWEFQFDAANRLTNTITPLNRQTTLTFDNRGLVKTVREPSGQIATNNYDAKGRLTNQVDAVALAAFNFDANNNVTNVVENRKTNTWTFDAYDQVSSYRDADGNLIQYRYDASGNLTNLVYPGGKTVIYFYDSLNRLTNVTDWANRKTSIEYDLSSRLKQITRPNGTQRILNYDAAGQTTNITEKLTIGFPIAFFKLNWDAAARMQWEFAAPLPHTNTPPSRTMEFDEDNRLRKFNGQWVTNDLDGNLTYGPLTNNTLVNYAYDARNRLQSVGGLSYGYDPSGNRTAVTNGGAVTRFVINPNTSIPQVLMRVVGSVTNYYIYGLDLLYEITETVTITNTLTYHFDYRGSTIALTDGNGKVTDRVEYSAYATRTYRTGTNDTPFLYNGRYGVQTDANGILYMQARYYNPHLCRFINADPSGFSGGLNFYAYADGNPVSMIDPFGLGAIGENTSPSWVQGNYNYLYTGQRNPSPGVYDAAVDAAADYVYNKGAVRGFSSGISYNGKVLNLADNTALRANVSLGASWTIDNGIGAQGSIGANWKAGNNNATIPSGGITWSEREGWHKRGGISLTLGDQNGVRASSGASDGGVGNFNLGLKVGKKGPISLNSGMVIDTTKVWGNFKDSFNVLLGKE